MYQNCITLIDTRCTGVKLDYESRKNCRSLPETICSRSSELSCANVIAGFNDRLHSKGDVKTDRREGTRVKSECGLS